MWWSTTTSAQPSNAPTCRVPVVSWPPVTDHHDASALGGELMEGVNGVIAMPYDADPRILT